MSKYTVYLTRNAQKDLQALPKEVVSRIIQALKGLEQLENPTTSGRKLVGRSMDEYRLRVGDYRVIYTIDSEAKEIRVFQVLMAGALKNLRGCSPRNRIFAGWRPLGPPLYCYCLKFSYFMLRAFTPNPSHPRSRSTQIMPATAFPL
ncbi:MAG: type II toxin-antitoxin system RelE/ParE family toxin [Candidatus Methanomethyliaceae archaeon]